MVSQKYKYAAYDLESSIEVARTLEQHGGSGSADELASWLGYKSKNNGAFLSRIASARLFGLVDGRSERLSPSALAISILRPDYPETAARARLTAFDNVPLNAEVLRHYQGHVLPDEQGLRNALQVKWNIDASRAGQVLARLMASAEQAGLFSIAGNRTKMIRPSAVGERQVEPVERPYVLAEIEDPDDEDAQGDGRRNQQPGLPPPVTPRPNSPRANKLIDGVLDELPPLDESWKEDQLQQWLAFLESALRVVYRLPKPGAVTTANGGGPGLG
jgi:hypothetical protein